jgi:hypothetical protein
VIKTEDRVEEFMRTVGISRRQLGRPRKGAPSCADCFFHRNQLCALDLDAPCSTYRKDGPEGLRPPRQPVLLVRQARDQAAA